MNIKYYMFSIIIMLSLAACNSGHKKDHNSNQKNIKPANIEVSDKTVNTVYYGETKPCIDFKNELFCGQGNILNAPKEILIRDENNNTVIFNKDHKDHKDHNKTTSNDKKKD